MRSVLVIAFLATVSFGTAAESSRRPSVPPPVHLDDADWRSYGKDAGFTHYSGLDQINRTNIEALKPAWVYHAGQASSKLLTTIECNPLAVGGKLFLTSPVLEVIALDGATGRQLWRYNPFPPAHDYFPLVLDGFTMLAILFVAVVYFRVRRRRLVMVAQCQCCLLLAMFSGQSLYRRFLPNPMKEERRQGPNRGLTYWESGSDRRILFAGGHHLVALNADTGKPIDTFGEHGKVDLTRGLGRDVHGLEYAVTSPGILYKNLIILGAKVGEGPLPAAPGHVRAFDVRTGEQRWIFHTIPQPGETGYQTWPPDAWQHIGGVNPWGGLSLDEARGLVFLPIGAATFDFYGGDRIGKNLFANSVVALHAATGQLAWYYQTVHHDLWDYDLASPPNLVTIHRNGKAIDAVVQPVKSGLIFILDRATGQPLFPVEERSVPPSTLDGEQAWPTQPFPLKPAPLSRLQITENDLTDISPEAHAYALRAFREAAGASIYVPPSKQKTIVTPGYHGGANWSGAAVDPRTATFVTNSNEVPYIQQMRDPRFWQRYKYSFFGFRRFSDQNGYPAVKPPWGKLTGIDLNTGEVRWQIPLGEYPELTKRGIPITGAENAGGAIITAGGLVFIGSTPDRKFRAFDLASGKLLWQAQLDFAAHATPSTYAAKGRQFVVIAAGGGSMVESDAGDEYVAFALPTGS